LSCRCSGWQIPKIRKSGCFCQL